MTSGTGSDHRVVLLRDGEEVTDARVPADETLLDAGEGAGLELRYGCREGRCSSCVGRLLDGEVAYVRPPRALTDDHREDGFVLLCSATPTADCRVEVGRGVLAEAYPSVWGHVE